MLECSSVAAVMPRRPAAGPACRQHSWPKSRPYTGVVAGHCVGRPPLLRVPTSLQKVGTARCAQALVSAHTPDPPPARMAAAWPRVAGPASPCPTRWQRAVALVLAPARDSVSALSGRCAGPRQHPATVPPQPVLLRRCSGGGAAVAGRPPQPGADWRQLLQLPPPSPHARRDDPSLTVDYMLSAGIVPDPSTVMAALHALAHRGCFAQFLRVFDRLLAMQPGVPKHLCEAALILLTEHRRATEAERVLEIYERSGTPSVKMYTRLMEMFAAMYDSDSAERMLVRMRRANVPPDVMAYNTVLHALAVARRVDRIRALIERMPGDGVAPSTVSYNILIDCWVRMGCLERAEAVLDDLSAAGLRPDVTTFNTLVLGWMKCRNVARAARIVHTVMPQHGVRPNAHTFTSLLLPSDSVARVESVIRDMCTAGAFPDLHVWNHLIGACMRQGDVARAMHIISHELPALRLHPNQRTFAALIQGWIDGPGDMDAAERVLDQMAAARVAPTQATYAALIYGWAARGQWARAEQLLERMQRSGLSMHETVYTALLNGCAAGDDVAKAEGYMQRFVKSDVLPQVGAFNALLRVYARAGAMDRAEHTLSTMHRLRVQPNACSYNLLMACAARMRDAERAAGILQRMRAAGVRPDNVTYSTMMTAAQNESAVRFAEQALLAMRADGLRLAHPSTLCAVLRAYARARDPAGTERVLALMRDGRVQPTPTLCWRLVCAWLHTNQPAHAERLMLRLIEEHLPNGALIVGQFAAAALEHRLPELAERALLHGHGAGVPVSAASSAPILRAWQQQRQPDRIQRLYASLCDRRLADASIHNLVLQAYAELRRADLAADAHQRCTRESVPLEWRSSCALAALYAESGNWQAAEQLLDAIAGSHPAQEPDAAAWLAIADALVEAGQWARLEGALRRARALGVRTDRDFFHALLARLLDRGRFELSLRVLDAMRQAAVPPTADTFAMLMQRCGGAVGAAERAVEASMQRVLDAMRSAQVPVTASVYHAQVAAWAQLGRLDAAERALDRMLADHSVSPSPSPPATGAMEMLTTTARLLMVACRQCMRRCAARSADAGCVAAQADRIMGKLLKAGARPSADAWAALRDVMAATQDRRRVAAIVRLQRAARQRVV